MRNRSLAARSALICLLIALASCRHADDKKATEMPAIDEAPVLIAATRRDLAEVAPGNGILVGGGRHPAFEINIEAADAQAVKPGQSAIIEVSSSRERVAAKVERIVRGVSAETGQAIAWLVPLGPVKAQAGEFVFANITTSVKRQVLSVPDRAILYKEGKSWLIKQELEKGAPAPHPVAVEIQTGASSGGFTEIKSGVGAGDSIALQGGNGALYPDFKAAGAD